ncbi:MAG: CoA transferase [Dehalococcoidia bacterium]
MDDDPTAAPGPLAGIRVVDLATDRAELAGRVLADLGADVIVVEPPGGSASRRTGPFEHGRESDPEASLYWASVAIGKRSVVLDIESGQGRAALRDLIAKADILIESFDPGVMDRLGFGYFAMRELNPALIYVSVTPFGQDGPDAASPATDLTLQAAGGLLGLQGDPDRPPIPVGYPQAAFHAGVQAAADAVVALNERAVSGPGQHLDVSMQAAVVWTLMHATGFPPNHGTDPPGTGERRADPPPQTIPGVNNPPRVWTCADGHFVCAAYLGAMGARTLDLLARWLEEEDALDADLRGINWRAWSLDVAEGRLTAAQANRLLARLEAFLKTKTKRQLMNRAVHDRLLLAPIFTVKDVVEDPQLATRGYWETIAGRRHPGVFARASRTPVVHRRPAPALGEGQALLHGARTRRDLPAPATHRRPAFEGLKVADFAWVGAAPLVSKALGDHGATVVHVESTTHPDVLRTVPPFKDAQPGLDRAQFMANFNSSKLGIAIDLETASGRAVARRLIDWADVVVESFTPGVLARHGLDYATISRGRPDLIMFSSCLRGQTGPERTYAGFGGQGAALAGIHSVTGWPDRPPAGPWGAYTDFISPRYSLAILAAAILDRRRTGLGQYIDFSQVEASIHFIEPLILDYTVNGRVAPPAGLSSPTASPNGVYATAGKERYIAISVETPAQWRALVSVAPLDAFRAPEFDDIARRRSVAVAIDQALCSWCHNKEPFALARELKAAGVPASVVLRPTDLYEDAQLAHRGFFVTLDHSVMGPTPYDGLVTIFSETPGQLRKAAPALGEDTEYVLRELLGFTDDEVAEHAATGAFV